eukprot:c26112_g1_i1.p1 GENE.c26112_g1_i1~~c26112_g1_i1.p1  ORF type:complete len:201 (+),score=41.83 c26112_g1_i1:636-1238(+)
MQGTRNHWLPQDDKLLQKLIAEHQFNWQLICKKIPNRSAKQCRDRWSNHLDPTLNKGNFTPEDDLELQQLLIECGPQWNLIAKTMNRSQAAVKNRRAFMVRKIVRNDTIPLGRDSWSVLLDLQCADDPDLDLLDCLCSDSDGKQTQAQELLDSIFAHTPPMFLSSVDCHSSAGVLEAACGFIQAAHARLGIHPEAADGVQ